MGFTEREIGHMTVKKYMALYKVYKDTFDLETRLRNNNLTYAQLEHEPTLDDVL